MVCQLLSVPAVEPLAAMLHSLQGPAHQRRVVRSRSLVAKEILVARWIFEVALEYPAVLVPCASLLATRLVVVLELVWRFRPVRALFLPVGRFALMQAPVRKVQAATLAFLAVTALRVVAVIYCCAVAAANRLRVAVLRLLRPMVTPLLVPCRFPRVQPQLDRVGTSHCRVAQLPVVLQAPSLLVLALRPLDLAAALL